MQTPSPKSDTYDVARRAGGFECTLLAVSPSCSHPIHPHPAITSLLLLTRTPLSRSGHMICADPIQEICAGIFVITDFGCTPLPRSARLLAVPSFPPIIDSHAFNCQAVRGVVPSRESHTPRTLLPSLSPPLSHDAVPRRLFSHLRPPPRLLFRQQYSSLPVNKLPGGPWRCPEP